MPARFLQLWKAGMLSFLIGAPALADDWPQWRGPHRDGVWHETGIVDRFNEPRLPLVWRAEIAGGYSGPTVAGGRVFVTDRLIEPNQVERVLCFDAASGRPLWTHTYDCPYRDVSYDAGPRAAVLVDGQRAYSLGAIGHLFCFDAADGRVLWQHELKSEYDIDMPIWGIAASPLLEGDLLIVQVGGAHGACLVAFDKLSGEERWRALDDPASYSAPILIEQAGRRVLICWTGHHVAGLDPSSGKLYWQVEFKPTRMVMNIATPVLYKDYLYMTAFFDGSLLLKLGQDQLTAEEVWRRRGPSEQETDGLQSIISTPLVRDDYIYGVDSYGELRCLKLLTGDRVWESLEAVPRARWSTIHFVEHGPEVWMFNERGELIISRLSPRGFEEISRAKLLEPTTGQLPQRGGVCWSHPAFAGRCVFARNDKELVCASLAAGAAGAGGEKGSPTAQSGTQTPTSATPASSSGASPSPPATSAAPSGPTNGQSPNSPTSAGTPNVQPGAALTLPAAPASSKKPLTRADLEKIFEQSLTGATLAGTWQMINPPAGQTALSAPLSDRYNISRVTKLDDDHWVITAQIQYGEKLPVNLPVPVRVEWAGDTPVITLDEMMLPFLGTYSARVMIYRDFYCGTWFGDCYGGVMSGQITRELPENPAAPNEAAQDKSAGDKSPQGLK